jgi:hypothetical protein
MVAQINNDYIRYGITKTFKRLTSYALIEGRPHTTKGQWFNPIVFSFLNLLRSIPGKPHVDRPIFITGLGRSGTTILGVLLSLHKEVGFLNEPKAVWKLIDPRHDVNGDYVLTGGKYILDKNDVTNEAHVTATRIFSRYLKLVQAKRLVDKYPELIFRLDYVFRLFSDAKIIFIVRNGIDVTHSIDLWSKRLGTHTNKGTEDWWGRNDIKWKYMIEQLFLNDHYFNKIDPNELMQLDHINRAALEWIVTMRTGVSQTSLYPESLLTLKYEELTENPEIEIEKIFRFCDLEHDNNVVDYANNHLYHREIKQPPNLHRLIKPLFDETMSSLEY